MVQREVVERTTAPSGTVAFLFSDIEGSTERWERNHDAMRDALRTHDAIMRDAIVANNGYVFKTMGDAFFAAFATGHSACAAARDAQRGLAAADFSAVDGLRVRMAINHGTADERDGDYFGPTLNRVARLLPLGHGGQVLLTGAVAELVRTALPARVELLDLGAHALKDLKEPERVHQLVAPELQRDFPELRSQLALQPWLVPEAMRTPYFTGRHDILIRLRESLRERGRAALSGLGGAGKTQTAVEYAVRHRSEYPNGVFWTNAETVSGLTGGFVDIARALRLPSADENDQEGAVKAVLAWFARSGGWLLILDNVDERSEVRRFVPERGRGHVLITSRESVFSEFGIPRALEVRDLAGDDSVRFLLTRTGREDATSEDRTAAAELAVELGHLPLALEQAASYVAETATTFTAYVGAFRKRRVSLLEKAAGLIAHETVAVTWAANFEAVQRASRSAADVLRLSAVLAPDAIPFEFFLDGAPSLGASIARDLDDADDLSLSEVLRPLTRYSLIRSDPEARVFGVHRLVQEIAWSALAEADRSSYIERATLALHAAFPIGEFGTWERCERLVAHVTALAERLASYNVQPEAAGNLLNRAGRYLYDRGRYGEAQALQERALEIGERGLGAEHPTVANSLSNLALVHEMAGRRADAQALNERALAIRQRTLGPDHQDVAVSLSNLGIAVFNRGDFAGAQALQERAVALLERTLGPEHPSLASALHNLAGTHFMQERHDEAIALYDRALKIRERTIGPEHPLVASTLCNLATVAGKAGRYGEAQMFGERALATWERATGPDHPDITYALVSLGEAHVAQGRHEDGAALFERALSIRERALGPVHLSLQDSLTSLGSLRREQGRTSEALALYERVLSILELGLAADHPSRTEISAIIDALHGE